MQEEKFDDGYVRPPLDLFNDYPETIGANEEEREKAVQTILRVFAKHKIPCEVTGITVGAKGR